MCKHTHRYPKEEMEKFQTEYFYKVWQADIQIGSGIKLLNLKQMDQFGIDALLCPAGNGWRTLASSGAPSFSRNEHASMISPFLDSSLLPPEPFTSASSHAGTGNTMCPWEHHVLPGFQALCLYVDHFEWKRFFLCMGEKALSWVWISCECLWVSQMASNH